MLKRGAPDRHREAKKLVDGGPCAYDCYKRNWEKDDLIIEEVDWSEEEKAIFAKSLETVGTSFCLIKLGLLGKTCNQVHEFYMSEEWPKFKKRLDAKRAQVLGSSWSTSTSLRNTAKVPSRGKGEEMNITLTASLQRKETIATIHVIVLGHVQHPRVYVSAGELRAKNFVPVRLLVRRDIEAAVVKVSITLYIHARDFVPFERYSGKISDDVWQELPLP